MSKLFEAYSEEEVQGVLNALNGIHVDEDDEDDDARKAITIDHLKVNSEMADFLYKELHQYGCEADEAAQEEMVNGWLEDMYYM